MIQSLRPDFAILDLNMPGVTGWQVHARLQREQPAVPVVFMTAARDAATEATRCGASGSLGKPFELMDLLTVVERFVPPRPSADR